jgi:hypothetical protein
MCVGSQHTRAGAIFFFWHWFCTAQSMFVVNPWSVGFCTPNTMLLNPQEGLWVYF